MPQAPSDNIAAWVARKGARILRRLWILQALTGLLFLALAYHMGRSHLTLVLSGASAQGRIVGYEEKRLSFRTDSGGYRTRTAFMPVVEFPRDGAVARFTDWKGSAIADGLHDRVGVLYDPENPASAMIDRSLWNWLPWAPCAALGGFLLVVAARGWHVSRADQSPANRQAQ